MINSPLLKKIFNNLKAEEFNMIIAEKSKHEKFC